MAAKSFVKTAMVSFTINKQAYQLEVRYDETLLSVIRDRLLMTGTKAACLQGECGSCAIRVDGKLTNTCLVPALQAEGWSMETVEGFASDPLGKAIQGAFLAEGACQCGYCIPGMLAAARSILAGPSASSSEHIRDDLEGNLCRCTGYTAIRRAIESARNATQEKPS